jgi:hypothetical protein
MLLSPQRYSAPLLVLCLALAGCEPDQAPAEDAAVDTTSDVSDTGTTQDTISDTATDASNRQRHDAR